MSWLRRLLDRSPGPGSTPVHVGDPRFDDWDVVRDFGSAENARAWHQHLRDRGIEGALTTDHPLDRFGRGDIALRVPPGQWSDAEVFLDNIEAENEDYDPIDDEL
ncbi:MAG: hypothetical protein ACR2NA_03285 [Solirubrobacterales bacterium]